MSKRIQVIHVDKKGSEKGLKGLQEGGQGN
jgi:hypothetical protein